MMYVKVVGKISLVLFLLLSLLPSASTSAQSNIYMPLMAQPDASLPFMELKSDAESEEAFASWGYEARSTTQAFALPNIGEMEAASAEAEEAMGSPGALPGARPATDADTIARQEYPDEWEREAAAIAIETILPDEGYAVDGSANVFSSYRGNYYSSIWKEYPYRTVGKLYIQTPTGRSWCTASVIGTNLIVTAAHCVYNTVTNRWHSNFSFVPADRNGSAPYGTFPYNTARVMSAWQSASGVVQRYDIALLTLRTNSSGRSVSYYTGWLGTAWNLSSTQHLHAFGYPSNIDSGRYSYICAAESFSRSTDVLGMGCNMEHGSSGGPWIRKFYPYAAPSGTNQVNSVVSGGVPGTPTFYGARFSSNNFRVLCANNWC